MLDSTNFQKQKINCIHGLFAKTICQKVKAAGSETGSGHMHVSEEWAKVKVVPSGSTKDAQQHLMDKKKKSQTEHQIITAKQRKFYKKRKTKP